MLRPDEDVTEISRRLRGARELAGLSIEDLAASTKIPRAALQAIERGEFDRLPGEFYTRAFLKAYAREVHLPPDEIVSDYDAGRTIAQPQPTIAVAASAGREPATWSIPAWLTGQSARSAGAVGLVVVVLLMMTVFKSPTADNRSPEPGAVGTSGVVEPTAAPAVASPLPGPAPDKLVLEIHPTGPTWVTGAADGTRVLYRLLSPGEHITVEARNDLSFRIGNAVAFAYAINGLPGKPLGGPDEIREFRITRENYRTFGR